MVRKDKLRLKMCAIKACKTQQMCGMYTFPRNKHQRKAWLRQCNIASENSEYKVICWKHFDEDDFKMPINPTKSKFGRLKPDVVPSKFLPKIIKVLSIDLHEDLNLGQDVNVGDDVTDSLLYTACSKTVKIDETRDHSYASKRTSLEKDLQIRLDKCQSIIKDKRHRNNMLLQKIRRLQAENKMLREGYVSKKKRNRQDE